MVLKARPPYGSACRSGVEDRLGSFCRLLEYPTQDLQHLSREKENRQDFNMPERHTSRGKAASKAWGPAPYMLQGTQGAPQWQEQRVCGQVAARGQGAGKTDSNRADSSQRRPSADFTMWPQAAPRGAGLLRPVEEK